MIFYLFFGLVGWITITGLLSSAPVTEVLKELKPIIYLLFLAAVIFYVSNKKPNFLVHFFYVLLISASISGFILTYEFYQPRHWNFLIRLRGSGAISNSIWVGAVYGSAALSSIILFLHQKTFAQQSCALLLGVIPLLVMLLSQSRGPMVAFVIALIYTLVLYRNRRAALMAAVMIILGILVVANFGNLSEQTRIFGGDSYRLGIWSNAINEISKAPLFGHGIAEDTKNFIDSRTFDHYHNVYLSLAFHSGFIGLALLLALTIYPLISHKTIHTTTIRPLLLFGMVYMLFDGNRLFTSPKELWLIFWIPLLLLWAYNNSTDQLPKPVNAAL